MIVEIKNDDELIGMIIKSSFDKEGTSFFSSPEQPQQIAFMRLPTDSHIQPHFHNEIPRNIIFTQETLIIRKGKLRVDFYTLDQAYLESHILEAGDLLFLIAGAHGFKILEELEMYEVKQGPYLGDQDKVRFQTVDDAQVKIVSHGAVTPKTQTTT